VLTNFLGVKRGKEEEEFWMTEPMAPHTPQTLFKENTLEVGKF